MAESFSATAHSSLSATESVHEQIERNDAVLREREAGIADINRTVRDVSDLFNDLALLVGDQGQRIDKCGGGRTEPRTRMHVHEITVLTATPADTIAASR